MLPTSAPAAASSNSTSAARNRNSSSNGNGVNNKTTNAMKRNVSVSRSLGAPDKARHLALLSRFAPSDFDPYTIFLTPHYSDEQLRRHRGWLRLLPEDHLVPLKVLIWYYPPILLELAVSGSLALYETYGTAAHGWKSLARSELAVPFQLTSFCLSILLVFRTTASFERWNEARKIWGSIGVETRTIARQAKAWVERDQSSRKKKQETAAAPPLPSSAFAPRGGAEEQEQREELRVNLAELLSWCAAAPIALKAAVATTVEGKAILRGVGHCHSEGGGFEGVLTQRQSRRLWRATGGAPLLAPPCVLDRVSAGLATLPISDMLLATLDARVAAIGALASAADRLKRQPIPPAYTRNTARFLAVWLCFLPLALWHPLQLWSIPACVIIAFLLVAVENVGSQLESPHPLLPVDELVEIAVGGVKDAGGSWWLEPEEREKEEEEEESESEEEVEVGELATLPPLLALNNNNTAFSSPAKQETV